jgi:hypothetical protein
MPTKRIKCFVAMAFGKKDSDTIYDRHIVPILRSLRIHPIRVDRREHRDDLNNYIIRMLNESDLTLADLTYSRPSVYYEAGFTERQIPVIYTVRRDHLRRTNPDDRYWVHFDLEMKKIIPWSDPNDPNFAKRLKKRIAYLAKPIIRQIQKKEATEREHLAFASLSVSSRCEEVYKTFQLMLKRKRFWTERVSQVDRPTWFRILPLNPLIGIKKVDKTCLLCIVLVAESLTRKQIETASNFIGGYRLTDREQDIIDYEDHYFLCSLRKMPQSRLTACHPSAQPTDSPNSFTLNFKGVWTSEKGSRVSIYLISPIKSIPQLRSEITSHISKLTDKKNNQRTYLLQNYRGEGRVQFRRKESSDTMGDQWRVIYPRRKSFKKNEK